jgi:acyl-CoA dehydrogenase
MNELPLIEFDNLFDLDSTGQKLWSYWLGPKVFEKHKARFSAMGMAGAKATAYSKIVDKTPPQLHNFNAIGERMDRIEYHPAYTELKRLSYGQEIVSLKYNKEFLKEHKGIRHELGFAIAYYFAQTEGSLFCPICMTDALGRVMERHNTLPQTQTALAHISSPDLSQLWEGAMFMTEKQGGSDVGANTVRAENKNGRWFLSGEKWFCSNADAKAILALARMPGAEGAADKGTRGLGLFLILREEPQNNSSTWIINRLKDKLGVRSMASGEITMNGTEAFLIGGAGEGFKIMTEMVNMSRIYNAVASLAIVRRSLMEAMAFGKERKAFGHLLVDLPLWKACISDLTAEHLGLMFIVFEATRQLDRADGGNEDGAKLLRLITPLAKGLGGKLSVFAASEAMELIGGNAYIEDHVLPRLLRDAQVLPIWEGTTNIQSLDLIRACQKEGPEHLIKRCELALAKNSAKDSLSSAVSERLSDLKNLFASLATMDPMDTQRNSRHLLETAARTLSLCLLIEATKDAALKPIVEAAAERLLERPSPTSALGGFAAKNLSPTEDVLLNSIF